MGRATTSSSPACLPCPNDSLRWTRRTTRNTSILIAAGSAWRTGHPGRRPGAAHYRQAFFGHRTSEGALASALGAVRTVSAAVIKEQLHDIHLLPPAAGIHLRTGLKCRRPGDARTLLEALRPGLTHESAADTAWALASPECWDLLIRRRGYSPQTYQAWVEDTLAAALLHPSLL